MRTILYRVTETRTVLLELHGREESWTEVPSSGQGLQAGTLSNTSQILQILLSYVQHNKGKALRQEDSADTQNKVSSYSRRHFAANISLMLPPCSSKCLTEIIFFII